MNEYFLRCTNDLNASFASNIGVYSSNLGIYGSNSTVFASNIGVFCSNNTSNYSTVALRSSSIELNVVTVIILV